MLETSGYLDISSSSGEEFALGEQEGFFQFLVATTLVAQSFGT